MPQSNDSHARWPARAREEHAGHGDLQHVALRFGELRVALWRAILARVHAVEAICAIVRQTAARELRPDGELERLVRLARALLDRDDGERRAAYAAQRGRTAALLGRADPDEVIVDRIAAELNGRDGELIDGPAAGAGRFAEHVAAVRLYGHALQVARSALASDRARLEAFAEALRPNSPAVRARLVEVGGRALQLAVGRFEPALGLRFSVCAGWWIQRMMRRALIEPRSTPALVAELDRTRREFAALHGRLPVVDELATLSGASERELHDLAVLDQLHSCPGRSAHR